MATQGIVSITKDGMTLVKCVAGCNGYQANELVDLLLSKQVQTAEAAYPLALECGFGCEECLVVLDEDSMIGTNDMLEETRERYRDTFGVAQFNPRWKHGTADHVEVREIGRP